MLPGREWGHLNQFIEGNDIRDEIQRMGRSYPRKEEEGKQSTEWGPMYSLCSHLES